MRRNMKQQKKFIYNNNNNLRLSAINYNNPTNDCSKIYYVEELMSCLKYTFKNIKLTGPDKGSIKAWSSSTANVL